MAIAEVITEVKKSLPEAKIYVFDNNSTDLTATVAEEAGAHIFFVKKQGKGHVVSRMFTDVEADIYLLVDGDATYDFSNAREFVSILINNKLDMVVGCRTDDQKDHQTYRAGHRFGNKFLTEFIKIIFGGKFTDMLSGYRVFSRRYVKSFPVAAIVFKIETELTIHALELNMPFLEVPVFYRSRPEGSQSKLNTYQDRILILKTIFKLIMSERTLAFFSFVASALLSVALILTIPILITYYHTGLVPRFPTIILSSGLMICGVLSLLCGIILRRV